MTTTITSLRSHLTWNHDIAGIGFTHHYREAPQLGMFHSTVPPGDVQRVQHLVDQALAAADQPTYVLGAQTITSTNALRWIQLRMEHGAIARFEAIVTTTFSNGQTHNQHVEVVPDTQTVTWARALHGSVYSSLGLTPP